MNKKKSYIKAFRITSIITEALFIILMLLFFILFYFAGKDDIVGNSKTYLPFMLVFMILATINIVFLVYAFEISLTEYYYKDDIIGVYAGGLYHLLYINDEVVCSVKSINSFKKITLNGKLNDSDVEASISSFTHVILKIDGKGIPPIGHNYYEDK